MNKSKPYCNFLTFRHSILFTLWVFQTTVFAQFTYSPDKVFVQNSALNALDYDGINITNNSNSKVLLKWKKISVDTCGGCYFDLCASGECYLGIPDSGTYNDMINPGQQGFLKMHFWTFDIECTSSSKVYIYDAANPNNGDTLTFILNASKLNSLIDLSSKNTGIQITPIPTTDKIFLKGIQNIPYQINLFDLNGNELIRMDNFLNEQALDVSPLHSGSYFLQIKSGGDITNKKILIAR